jgi:hypothetical protein
VPLIGLILAGLLIEWRARARGIARFGPPHLLAARAPTPSRVRADWAPPVAGTGR